jgi:hypothetical protein
MVVKSKARGKKMARIGFKRKPCTKVYLTKSGPVRCPGGCLKGKDYCARHRPIKLSRGKENESRQETSNPRLQDSLQSAKKNDDCMFKTL